MKRSTQLDQLPRFSLIMALILSFPWCTTTRPGITEADHFVVNLKDKEKRIYLFGDTHNEGTPEEKDQQVVDFVAALKETSDDRNGPMHILWEKAGSYLKWVSDEYHNGAREMLLNIDSEIAQQEVENVTIKDEEIRQIVISANHVLDRGWQEGENNEKFRLYDEVETYVGALTFGDIEKAYHECLPIVEDFYEQNKDSYNLSNGYFIAIDDPKYYYEGFKDLMKDHTVTAETNISEFAFNCWKNRRMAKNIFGEECYLHQIFGEQIAKIFAPLFDAYLFKRICETQEDYIGIIAGAGHTRNIGYMLLEQNGKRILYEEKKNGILSKSYLKGILRGYSFSNKVRSEIELFFMKSLIATAMSAGKMYTIGSQAICAVKVLCGGLNPKEPPQN